MDMVGLVDFASVRIFANRAYVWQNRFDWQNRKSRIEYTISVDTQSSLVG